MHVKYAIRHCQSGLYLTSICLDGFHGIYEYQEYSDDPHYAAEFMSVEDAQAVIRGESEDKINHTHRGVYYEIVEIHTSYAVNTIVCAEINAVA